MPRRHAAPSRSSGAAGRHGAPAASPAPVAARGLGAGRHASALAAPALTHVDDQGRARMVDVGLKAETAREAVAAGRVVMAPATLAAITGGLTPKGDVLAAARLAGIQAAKQAADWIPLCHPLRLTGVELALEVVGSAVEITATVNAFDRSGVEMEALDAVSAAALTVYDMCKAIDRAMVIGEIRLDEKRGGKSGTWVRTRMRKAGRRSVKKR